MWQRISFFPLWFLSKVAPKGWKIPEQLYKAGCGWGWTSWALPVPVEDLYLLNPAFCKKLLSGSLIHSLQSVDTSAVRRSWGCPDKAPPGPQCPISSYLSQQLPARGPGGATMVVNPPHPGFFNSLIWTGKSQPLSSASSYHPEVPWRHLCLLGSTNPGSQAVPQLQICSSRIISFLRKGFALCACRQESQFLLNTISFELTAAWCWWLEGRWKSQALLANKIGTFSQILWGEDAFIQAVLWGLQTVKIK